MSILRILIAIALSIPAISHPLIADSPKPITAEEAVKKIGETVTVSAKIQSVSKSDSNVLYLNFGDPYPSNTLTLVILPELRKRFPDAESLSGATVKATGKVIEYNGLPRIILRDPAQLTAAAAAR